MDRRITGFHQDDEQHWVAELECGHTQHVRHDPPWQVRPWVVAEDTRRARLGTTLPCRRCDPEERYLDARMQGLCPDGAAEAARTIARPGSSGSLPLHLPMEGRMIEPLTHPAAETDIQGLAQLLVDTVEAGAAVSFVTPLPLERAAAWWRGALAGADPRAVFLVARDAAGIAGTVQMHPAWAPNQPHRADIAKLMVHPRARRRGLGAQLMEAIETAAARAGFRLLTLDTKRGEPSEALYRRMGWTMAGIIPRYALDSDGTPHDTVIFYKELG